MEQQLYEAAIQGSLTSLSEILSNDKQILHRVGLHSSNAGSPLHVAASRGHSAFVTKLLKLNPDLANTTDSRRQSPLHLAVARGHLSVVTALAYSCPEMCEARDSEGRTPLHLAVARGHLRIATALASSCPEMCEARDSEGRTPLHVAASKEFVTELLKHNPDLADTTDSRRQSPLHLAVARGHLPVVTALASSCPEMCEARDLEGRIPLHVAAVKGKVEVVEQLVQANPLTVGAKVEGSETILHLCAKKGQWAVLKLLLSMISSSDILNRILSSDILNAKDGGDGNTVLHLAVADKQLETIRQLLTRNKVDINPTNANGYTPLDILSQGGTDSEINIRVILLKFGARRGKDLVELKWLMKNRDILVVVASLVATIAFQTGVNPPGGVWQDNSNDYRAGESVMAYNHPDSFPYFVRVNSIGLVASLSIIFLLISGLPFRRRVFLWILRMMMLLTMMSMAFTYAFSITVVTPKKDKKSLSFPIVVVVIVLCSMMVVFLLIHTIRLGVAMVRRQWYKYKAISIFNT